MNAITHNIYIPFPRYENAVFIGDTACCCLAHLKIYGRAVIGGELPNIGLFRPYEKSLECTQCVINDQKLLTVAMRRGQIDYVLLENNGKTQWNPSTLRESLEEKGIKVLVLDTSGTPQENLIAAGRLFNEEKRAQRAVKEYEKLMEIISKIPVEPNGNVLTLMAIRNPVDNRKFLFALSDESSLSKKLYKIIKATNPVKESNYKTVIPGMVGVDNLEDFLRFNPESIVLTGDCLGLQEQLALEIRNDSTLLCKALKNLRVFDLPYYDDPLSCELPNIASLWLEVFSQKP